MMYHPFDRGLFNLLILLLGYDLVRRYGLAYEGAAPPCPRLFGFHALPPVLLEVPISVIERTDLTGLEPSCDAVEMESMLVTLSA